MAKAKKVKAKTEPHPTYKTPRRYYDIREAAGEGTAKETAEAFLKKVATDLQIKPDLSQLKFDRVKESILGKHVLFQQYADGKPISGAWARVDVNPAGEVYNVLSELVPEKALAKTAKKTAAAVAAGPPVSQEQAKAAAVAATGGPDQPVTIAGTEEVMYPVDGVPRAAWKVVVVRERPHGEWKVYVDAAAGTVLAKVDLLKAKDGRGRVFDPNPVVTLNDTSLRDDEPVPDAAYTEVVLRDLDGGGHLDGPFVSTKTTPNRVKRADLDFRFKRADRGFKEAMVYFHIDRVQRYVQELGFTNVLNKPIPVNIDGTTDDNSFYSPVSKSLTFGTGGVDDAEDAEIILHEYGHAIQDDQVSGFGATAQGRAMGEGFGDYWAASFFAEAKPAAMRPTVGNWDATAYSGANPPFLRRLDSNKLFPRDLTGEEHADGEIWSACLWEVRRALGRKTTDKLVLAHHFLLSPQSGFEDGANALLTADGQLNDGRNADAIRAVFVARGILPNAGRNNKRAGIPFDAIHAGPSRNGRKPTPARIRQPVKK